MMDKQLLLRGFSLLLTFVLLMQGTSSCTGGQATENIATVNEQGSVWRVEPVVWAGINTPLPEINTNAAATVVAGTYIQTDDDGIAKVLFTGCEYIYLYRNSSLSKGTCEESSAGSGNWLCNGAIEVDCQSKITIFTPSTKIETAGTRFYVEYFPGIELTILEVIDGRVNVWPVLASSLDPEDPNNLGTMYTIDPGLFWFTIPGNQPFFIDRFQSQQLYAFNEWTQFKPAVKQFYFDEGSQLDGWLEQMNIQSTNRGLDFPSDLILSGPVLNGAGPLLNRMDVQDAILSAVDWNRWVETSYRMPDTQLRAVFPGREPIDVRTLTFELEVSRKLVSGLNLEPVPENTIFVIIPLYSREFEAANLDLASMLKEMGLVVEVIQVEPDQLSNTIQAFLDEGRSVLWITQP